MKKNRVGDLSKSAVLAFLGITLVLLGIWNQSLFKRINTSQTKIKKISEYVERAEKIQNENNNLIKDVFIYKSIDLCFRDLIKDYKKKYSSEGIKSCIRTIMIADEKYSKKGLDAPLILAWLEKESGGNPEAVSYAGAMGLTQLMDFNAKKLFLTMGCTYNQKKLIFRPDVNLEGGIHYINDLMNLWENKGIHNKILILFYSLHSYKWGIRNTFQLFNSERRAYRPAIEYVNWILNRREYWADKLEYYRINYNKYPKLDNGKRFDESLLTKLLQ